jgi:hypothetical protein
MKIKGKLIALAIACAGVPATVVGKDPGLDGTFRLKIDVQGVSSPISAIAKCTGARTPAT